MAASFVFGLVLAHAACLLAVPVHEINYIDFDKLVSTFLNDVDQAIDDNYVDTDTEITLKSLKESRYECENLYSHICDRNAERNLLSTEEFKQKTSEFYSIFKQKITDLLNSSESEGLKIPSVDLERQLYQRCMTLGTDNEENSNDIDQENTIKFDDVSNDNYSTGRDENDDDDDDDDDDHDQVKIMFSKFLKSFGYKNILTKTWQQLDQKLATIGFGHAFYDISVIADPIIPNKNIILLQPPSIKKWNSIKFIDTLSDIYVHFQTEMYEYCVGKIENEESSEYSNDVETGSNESQIKSNSDSDEEPAFLESIEESKSTSEEKDAACMPFQSLTELSVTQEIVNDDEETILMFFNRLLKAIFDSISVTSKENFSARLTINQWNKKYNNISRMSTSKIDWLEVIKSEFEQVGIEVNDTEYIFIKNVPYFRRLAMYLNFHSNEILDKAIRSKLLAENVRFIDWEWNQSVNSIDQSTFCFEQTQLFGVSQKALKSVTKNFLKPHIAIMEVIVKNVADVLYYNISENVNLNNFQKTYLKSQLQAITNNLLSNKYDRSDSDLIFEDYYADFKATSNYFVDINIYRKMIKNKILKTLGDNTPLTYDYLPFDINEIENPRNRLILYTLSNIYIESLKSLEYFNSAEQYYATFGVKLAGFLYSLVIENKFQNDVHDLHGSQWLTAHVSYSPKVVKCFVPEDIVAYGYPLAYSTITEIFSVRIALAAFFKDYEYASVHGFYEAYIESYCGTKERKMIHKVLSNLEDIPTAFNCLINENSVELKCDMTLSEIEYKMNF